MPILVQTTHFAMSRKEKLLFRLRRQLYTIIETAEVQDDKTAGCLHSESPRKSVFSSDKHASEEEGQTKSRECTGHSKPELVILPPEIFSKTCGELSTKWNAAQNIQQPSEPCIIMKTTRNHQNGKRERSENKNDCPVKAKDPKPFRVKEVEKLFPDFFCRRTDADCCDESEKGTNLVEKNIKDPLIQSWLDLFGMRSS